MSYAMPTRCCLKKPARRHTEKHTQREKYRSKSPPGQKTSSCSIRRGKEQSHRCRQDKLDGIVAEVCRSLATTPCERPRLELGSKQRFAFPLAVLQRS